MFINCEQSRIKPAYRVDTPKSRQRSASVRNRSNFTTTPTISSRPKMATPPNFRWIATDASPSLWTIFDLLTHHAEIDSGARGEVRTGRGSGTAHHPRTVVELHPILTGEVSRTAVPDLAVGE